MAPYKNQRISARDLLFIGLLLAAGIIGMTAVRIGRNRGGAAVQVTVDGELYGRYPLEQSGGREIPITVDGRVSNTLQLEEGSAKMILADSPDKLCVHQKAVSKQGETIVCLPNKIVVEIRGSEKTEFDSISK